MMVVLYIYIIIISIYAKYVKLKMYASSNYNNLFAHNIINIEYMYELD